VKAEGDRHPALDRAEATIGETVQQLRDAIFELHPYVLDEAGLDAAVRSLAVSQRLLHALASTCPFFFRFNFRLAAAARCVFFRGTGSHLLALRLFAYSDAESVQVAAKIVQIDLIPFLDMLRQ